MPSRSVSCCPGKGPSPTWLQPPCVRCPRCSVRAPPAAAESATASPKRCSQRDDQPRVLDHPLTPINGHPYHQKHLNTIICMGLYPSPFFFPSSWLFSTVFNVNSLIDFQAKAINAVLTGMEEETGFYALLCTRRTHRNVGAVFVGPHTRLIHIYNALLHLNEAFCDLFLIYLQKCSPGLLVQTRIELKIGCGLVPGMYLPFL